MEDYIVNGVCLECGVKPKDAQMHNAYHDDMYGILENIKDSIQSLLSTVKTLLK